MTATECGKNNRQQQKKMTANKKAEIVFNPKNNDREQQRKNCRELQENWV